MNTPWHGDVPLAPLVDHLRLIDIIASWLVRYRGWPADLRDDLEYDAIRSVYERTESIELTAAYCHRDVAWTRNSTPSLPCDCHGESVRDRLASGDHLFCALQYKPVMPRSGPQRIRPSTDLVPIRQWNEMPKAADRFVEMLLRVEAVVYGFNGGDYSQVPRDRRWLSKRGRWGEVMVAPVVTSPWGRVFT